MTGRILVFRHQPDVSADALGDRLEAEGVELVVADVAEGGPLPDLTDFDALVVLGGEMDVWQEDEHPWLPGEKAALREWMAGPVRPLLGICLGHQLLADALGGDVGPRAVAEAGVQPVHRSRRGVGDPLVGALAPVFPTLQWHGAEVRRVPQGAVVLASNERCGVQAMRVGAAAWGLQFHPEIGGPTAGRWGRHPVFRTLLDGCDGPGSADRYPEALAAAQAALDTVTGTLAVAFLAQVRASAAR